MKSKPLDLNEAVKAFEGKPQTQAGKECKELIKQAIDGTEFTEEKGYKGETVTYSGQECRELINKSQGIAFEEKDELLTSEDAAAVLGISSQTLRKWESTGKVIPAHKTAKGHRRYTKQQITEIKKQQMQDAEYLIPDINAAGIKDIVDTMLRCFDPLEELQISLRVDSVLRKFRITIDSADGLTSITRSFNID